MNVCVICIHVYLWMYTWVYIYVYRIAKNLICTHAKEVYVCVCLHTFTYTLKSNWSDDWSCEMHVLFLGIVLGGNHCGLAKMELIQVYAPNVEDQGSMRCSWCHHFSITCSRPARIFHQPRIHLMTGSGSLWLSSHVPRYTHALYCLHKHMSIFIYLQCQNHTSITISS